MENFENIRLPWRDWKIVKYLGGGAYGKVYEIERNNSGIREKAAVKIVSRPKEESELEADYQNGYDRESIAVKYTEILQEYINEYKLMKELQGWNWWQNLYPYGASDTTSESDKGTPFI